MKCTYCNLELGIDEYFDHDCGNADIPFTRKIMPMNELTHDVDHMRDLKPTDYDRLRSQKVRFTLIPQRALKEVGLVLTVSAPDKDKGGIGYESRVDIKNELDALSRHLNEYLLGKETDTETFRPTLAHVAARAMIALEIYIRGREKK